MCRRTQPGVLHLAGAQGAFVLLFSFPPIRGGWDSDGGGGKDVPSVGVKLSHGVGVGAAGLDREQRGCAGSHAEFRGPPESHVAWRPVEGRECSRELVEAHGCAREELEMGNRK